MRSIIIPAPDQDRGPCVPAAMSIVLDVPFDQINRWLVYRGYRDKRIKGIGKSLAVGGTAIWKIPMNQIGLSKISDSEMIGLSVNQFAQKYSEGTYLIRVHHHALAVRNGIAYDVQKDPTKKIVKEVWRKIETRLPSDWQLAQQEIQKEEERIEKIIKSKETRIKREKIYKLTLKENKEIRNTPQYQLEQLLKRKKQWMAKFKKAQTYLKKVERAIKRVEKKIQVV